METQTNELEVMRQQLAILNKKLENQAIVNKQLMREAMKNKMLWIKKYIWGELFVIPFLIIFFFAIATIFELSYGPVIFISLMLIVSIVCDFKINMIDDRCFFDNDLTRTARQLVTMKRQRILYEVAMLPVLFIWVIWYLYDIYQHTPSEGWMSDALTGGLVGGVIGCVGGVIIGLLVVRKMQRTNDEIIKQINDLTEK